MKINEDDMNFKQWLWPLTALPLLLVAGCGAMAPEPTKKPDASLPSYNQAPAGGLIHGLDFSTFTASLMTEAGRVTIRIANKKVDICGPKQSTERHSEVAIQAPAQLGEYAVTADNGGGNAATTLMFFDGTGTVPVSYPMESGKLTIASLSAEEAMGYLYVWQNEDNFINGHFVAKSCHLAEAHAPLKPRMDYD